MVRDPVTSSPRSASETTGRRATLAFAGAAVVAFLLVALPVVANADARAVSALAGTSAKTAMSVSETTGDFAVTPLVSPRVREFVASDSDFERSSILGPIITPLVIVLLVAQQLLAVAGRPNARAVIAYALPLLASFVMLVLVRIREYIG
jgi:hypothetical protein